MGRPKLSPVFPPGTKPARAGWYDVQFPRGWARKWWNGLWWVDRPGGTRLANQARAWRGRAGAAPMKAQPLDRRPGLAAMADHLMANAFKVRLSGGVRPMQRDEAVAMAKTLWHLANPTK